MLLGLAKPKPEHTKYYDLEVLSNDQMSKADVLSVQSGMTGYDLMTMAGQSVANLVHEYYPEHAVLVLCGPGNNGGDGFVAARFLQEAGHDVMLYAMKSPLFYRGDARKAVQHWNGKTRSVKKLPQDLPDKVVVIDALFGTGLSKPLESPIKEYFELLKVSEISVVAVDVPSGVHGDTGAVDPHALKVEHCVTFFRKKLGHLLMPGRSYCGEVTVSDIGIISDVLEATSFQAIENMPPLWLEALPQPDEDDHKFERGHVVVLGGERMTGAARMSSQAAMRAGAGLCTIAADPVAADVYRTDAPHIMFEPLKALESFGSHLDDKRRNVAIIGPGAGLEHKAELQNAVLSCLRKKKSVVIDADALSCFEGETEALFSSLHENAILTPHEGEFAKLFPDLEGTKLERINEAVKRSGAVIVLKGADTIIASPQMPSVINTHATPWLATAGSGDVLAGIIGGFLAQGMAPHLAAMAAVWIHGEAALRFGAGLTAPDIIATLPDVLHDLLNA